MYLYMCVCVSLSLYIYMYSWSVGLCWVSSSNVSAHKASVPLASMGGSSLPLPRLLDQASRKS